PDVVSDLLADLYSRVPSNVVIDGWNWNHCRLGDPALPQTSDRFSGSRSLLRCPEVGSDLRADLSSRVTSKVVIEGWNSNQGRLRDQALRVTKERLSGSHSVLHCS